MVPETEGGERDVSCPFCKSSASVEIFDSRPFAGGQRRRRKCGRCGKRWTTVELRIPDGGKLSGDDMRRLEKAAEIFCTDEKK